MSVRHTRVGPVFILGHGRSGTTILTQLVKKYLAVAFGTESQFILRFHGRLARYGDLGLAANRQRLLGDISRERFFERTGRNFGFVLDQSKVERAMSAPTYAAMLAGIFAQLAEHNGLSRWGDKTPEYIEHPSILRSLFPDAQFVHVVRDGRDVALSSFLTHFGGKNAYKTATDWAKAMTAMRRFAEEVPAGCLHQLRYEDLMADPVASFSPLIPFLGIDDADGLVREAVARGIAAEVRQDNAYKWRTRMSASQVAIFEAVAGSHLSHYGYERRYPEAAPLGAWTRARWMVDHKIRQYARSDYWQDNWYKLGVRSRLWRSRLRVP